MARGIDIEDFAAKLKLAMDRANLSRAALAQALGMDKSVVARWLLGSGRPADHSLSILSALIERHCKGFSRTDWDRPMAGFAAGLGLQAAPANALPPAPAPAYAAGFGLTGLPIQRHATLEEPYFGLWVGFMQSSRNRGSIHLCSLFLWAEENGMRCRFTEGRFWGDGPAIASVARLQCFWLMAPANDRVCAMMFNGVFSSDEIMMDGLALSAAGDATATPGAVPMVFFRVGDAAVYEALGGLAGVRGVLARENAARAPDGGDALSPMTDLAPPSVLSLLRPVVGSPRPDGGFDHMLRAPIARAQAAMEAAGPDDLGAARAVRAALHRMLGLS